jgi:hypothetical protein
LTLPQHFEYKVLRVLGKRPESLEAELNKLGADGWMVVYAAETIIILGRSSDHDEKVSPQRPGLD